MVKSEHSLLGLGGERACDVQGISMWVWTLNWDEIRSDLLVGSCPMTAADLDTIKAETGATALLSLQTDDCLRHFGLNYADQRDHGERIGLEMVRAPMRDFDLPDQRRHLPHAVRALNRLLTARHRVYVHCTAGMGRSPLTMLAYLTFMEDLSLHDALSLLKTRRPCVVPSLEAYHGCRQDLIVRHREDIETRAWHLYQRRCAWHRQGTSQSDWGQAEREVIRAVLS